jgi:hypothetical protein
MVLVAVLNLASYANEFPRLSQVAGNQVQVNPLIFEKTNKQ